MDNPGAVSIQPHLAKLLNLMCYTEFPGGSPGVNTFTVHLGLVCNVPVTLQAVYPAVRSFTQPMNCLPVYLISSKICSIHKV